MNESEREKANNMTMKEAVRSVFSNYATFSGRARRSEFWYFTLFSLLVCLGLFVLAVLTGGVLTFLMWIFSLATLLPTLAVTWRRLHDIGKSGKYFFMLGVPDILSVVFLIISLVRLSDGKADAIGAYILLTAVCSIASFVLLIVFIVWLCQDSQAGENKYGQNPKLASAAGNLQNGQPALPPRGNHAAYYLEGLSGMYQGQRIPLQNSLLIGRSASCNLIYPAEIQGISRQHCEFFTNGNQLMVRDLGSTNGTYVNGNHRIGIQATTLYPGDRVFIGSGKQCFAVCA